MCSLPGGDRVCVPPPASVAREIYPPSLQEAAGHIVRKQRDEAGTLPPFSFVFGPHHHHHPEMTATHT